MSENIIGLAGDYLEPGDLVYQDENGFIRKKILPDPTQYANQQIINILSNIFQASQTFQLPHNENLDGLKRVHYPIPQLKITCPDCKNTGKYQPLFGPVEDCRTCQGKKFI